MHILHGFINKSFTYQLYILLHGLMMQFIRWFLVFQKLVLDGNIA